MRPWRASTSHMPRTRASDAVGHDADSAKRRRLRTLSQPPSRVHRPLLAAQPTPPTPQLHRSSEPSTCRTDWQSMNAFRMSWMYRTHRWLPSRSSVGQPGHAFSFRLGVCGEVDLGTDRALVHGGAVPAPVDRTGRCLHQLGQLLEPVLHDGTSFDPLSVRAAWTPFPSPRRGHVGPGPRDHRQPDGLARCRDAARSRPWG